MEDSDSPSQPPAHPPKAASGTPSPDFQPAKTYPAYNPQTVWVVAIVSTPLLEQRRQETGRPFPYCMGFEEYDVLAGFLHHDEAREFFDDYLAVSPQFEEPLSVLVYKAWKSNREKVLVKINGKPWLQCN